MNKIASLFNRVFSAFVGMSVGGIVGMIAFYCAITLIGTDISSSNVRPGAVVGGVIGLTFGFCYPKRWGVRSQKSSRQIATALLLLAAGIVCFSIVSLGLLTDEVYDIGVRGKVLSPRDLVSLQENPILFVLLLLIWITLGLTAVGLSFWNLLEAGGRSPALATLPGVRMLLSKWTALSEISQMIIAVTAILSPFLYLAVLGFLSD